MALYTHTLTEEKHTGTHIYVSMHKHTYTGSDMLQMYKESNRGLAFKFC